MNQDQALDQWGTNAIGKFQRRGSGTAFTAVDSDKVWGNPRFHHRLANGKKFPAFAHTEFKPHRFAAAELSQLGNELKEFNRGGKRRVSRRR